MNSHRAEILIELYKRGSYGELDLSTKQQIALRNLNNYTIKELLYGGGAGGGKTWLGCLWLILNSYAYPDTKWFIGRKSIKDLEGSVSVTLNKVCNYFGFEKPKYNGKNNWFVFPNGSQIDFKECRYRPDDKLYERLGSIEYTGGWVEEGGEIAFDAYDTLKSRIGRHNNDKYNIRSKILITCNPKKNWLYKFFYKPFKNKQLSSKIKFIPALVGDNEHLGEDYIENLNSIKDKARKERLLHGNWEYDDDPSSLIESYDAIIDTFTNHGKRGKKYITSDVARFGSDKARICVWDGYAVIEHASFDISKTTEISDKIKYFQKKYLISNRNTIVDADGVGGGVMDEVNCLGFINNSRPIKTKKNENFDNLKSQCGFALAEIVNENSFAFKAEISEEEKEEIIEELEQLKRDDIENDSKKKLIKKKDIKQAIGRSPDWLDTFIMRMYFDLKPKTSYSRAN